MFRGIMLTAVLMAGALVFEPALSLAQACPSCKAANATDSKLPMAYQYSILFMLAMPAMLVTGLGVGLYRLNRAQEQATAAFESGDVWYGDPRETSAG